MTGLLFAVGAVLCFEGLVLALAPKRLEDVMELLARLSLEQRRMIGLSALGAGVALLWFSRLGL